MGKIFEAIDKQIIKPRVDNAYNEGLQMTKEDIKSFYDVPPGTSYERTYKYKNSPDGSPPSGGDGNYNYEIRLNVSDYSTGTYSGQKVFEEAQWHGSGILGRAGTWFEAEEDIKEAIKKNFR